MLALAAAASPPSYHEPDLNEAVSNHFLKTAPLIHTKGTEKGVRTSSIDHDCFLALCSIQLGLSHVVMSRLNLGVLVLFTLARQSTHAPCGSEAIFSEAKLALT